MSATISKFTVTVQNLKQDKRAITLDNETTVYGIKQRIEIAFGYPIDQQRLVFAGKVLSNDTQTAGYLKMVSDSLIICMVNKKAETKVDAKVETKTDAKPEAKPEVKPAVKPTVDSSAFKVDVKLVDQLCDMGFDKGSVMIALEMAKNNSQIALNYLTDADIPGEVNGHISHGHDAYEAMEESKSSSTPAPDTSGTSGTAGVDAATLKQLTDMIAHKPEMFQNMTGGAITPDMLGNLQTLMADNPDYVRELLAHTLNQGKSKPSGSGGDGGLSKDDNDKINAIMTDYGLEKHMHDVVATAYIQHGKDLHKTVDVVLTMLTSQ